MGIRFSKRIKILPGISLNLSKTGISVSLGTRGMRVTANKHGVRKTIGIPGTGLSATSYSRYENASRSSQGASKDTHEVGADGVQSNTNLYFVDIAGLILSFPRWHGFAKLVGIIISWIVICAAIFQWVAFVGGLSLLFLFISMVVFFIGVFSPGMVRQPGRFAVIEASIIYFILGVGGVFIYNHINSL
jgi:hypothetical protein